MTSMTVEGRGRMRTSQQVIDVHARACDGDIRAACPHPSARHRRGPGFGLRLIPPTRPMKVGRPTMPALKRDSTASAVPDYHDSDQQPSRR